VAECHRRQELADRLDLLTLCRLRHSVSPCAQGTAAFISRITKICFGLGHKHFCVDEGRTLGNWPLKREWLPRSLQTELQTNHAARSDIAHHKTTPMAQKYRTGARPKSDIPAVRKHFSSETGDSSSMHQHRNRWIPNVRDHTEASYRDLSGWEVNAASKLL
jgi:hypothetical protein